MCPRHSRRRTLRAAASLLGLSLAGCTASPRSDSTATASDTPTSTAGETTASADDGTRTLAPGEAYATADGWSVTVENLAVRAAIVEFGTVHPDPRYADDGQFVVADAVVSGVGAPDPADLGLRGRTDGVNRTDRYYVAAESNEDDARQRFGFEVPASPVPTTGAVALPLDGGPTARWELPERLVTALGRPPAFSVRGFEARDVPGDAVEATLTVENEGVGDGSFLAEVGDAALSDQPEVRVAVPAGDRVTATRRVPAHFGDRTEMTVVLRWRGETRERTVRRTTATEA